MVAAPATTRPSASSTAVARFPAGTVGVLAAWCLVAVGISLNYGQFSPVAIVLVLAGELVLLGTVASGRPVYRPAHDGAGLRSLAAPAVVVVVGAAVATTDWHIAHPNARMVSEWLMRAAVAAAVVALLPGLRARRRAFGLPAGLAVAAGVAMILAAPDPRIDVWYLLQQSATGLVHGSDMYRQTWAHSTGLHDVYPYLPITTVLLLPARLLLGDVRYELLAATALAAWLLYRESRRDAATVLPALVPMLLLVLPRATFAVQQSWTEPLLVLALVVMALAVRHGRFALAVVAFAVALATKQHIALLLPLAVVLPGFGWRGAVRSVGLAVLLVLPWLVAGPGDFVHDAVQTNLDYPVLRRALCLPSLLLRHGVTTTFVLTGVALVVAFVLALRRLPRTPGGFCLGSALVLLTLDVTNKQSFFNHYTLPMALLVAGVALAPSAANAAPRRKIGEVCQS